MVNKTHFYVSIVCISTLLATSTSIGQLATAEKDLFSLILVVSDLTDARKLMTMYDPNEDGFIDKDEQQRLSWRDEVREFDLNRDGKLTHMEVAVRQAKRREVAGITQFDRNNVNKFLQRYDTNGNKQIDPIEITQGGWPADPPSFDKNKDGIISQQEMLVQFAFNRGVRRELGIESVDQTGAMRTVKRHDQDNDNRLDADERAKTYIPRSAADFDNDEDGKLGIMELATMYAKHRRDLGLTVPDQMQIRQLFEQCDFDGNGILDGREVDVPPEAKEQMFGPFDSNKDGKITMLEAERVLADRRKKTGYAQSDYAQAARLLTRHDTNKNMSIDRSELFVSPSAGQLPRSLLQSADSNKDQKLSRDELARHLAKQKNSK